MSILTVTIVGQDVFDLVTEVGSEMVLNRLNPINNGMLGNLKTLTVRYDIPDDKIIEKRREFMDKLVRQRTPLFPMYLHEDWTRIFVFKSLAFKTNI